MNDQSQQSLSERLTPEILSDIVRVTQGRFGKEDIDHLADALLETKQQLLKVRRERDNALSDLRQAHFNFIHALHERNEARKQRDALAEALREIRYGHTDKAEKMAIEALNYLTK